MELFALTETAETVSKDCLQWLWRHKSKLLPVWTFVNTIYFVTMRYLLTQRVVMLRVGVMIKQIENKHLQNWLIFRVWIIWETQKFWGALPPHAPPWLRACIGLAFMKIRAVSSWSPWILCVNRSLIKMRIMCQTSQKVKNSRNINISSKSCRFRN